MTTVNKLYTLVICISCLCCSSMLNSVEQGLQHKTIEVLGQERTIRITPREDGSFLLELIRNGEIVYDGVFRYYEDSGRYENVRNSFEYVEFSDTAGDTSLGCDRPPDIRGFFNGAEFEGRVGC